MKLKYTKPAFEMERFDLAQSIATSCTAINRADPNATIGDPNQWTKSTCAWVVGGYALWNHNGCDVPASVDEDVMGYCYNNPEGHNVIFNS